MWRVRLSMQVRMYRNQDFEYVWPLFQQVSLFHGQTDASSAEQIKAYVKDKVLSKSSSVNLALALQRNTPIGFATFANLYPGPSATGQLYLKELFIHEQHRDKGAGKALERSAET